MCALNLFVQNILKEIKLYSPSFYFLCTPCLLAKLYHLNIVIYKQAILDDSAVEDCLLKIGYLNKGFISFL